MSIVHSIEEDKMIEVLEDVVRICKKLSSNRKEACYGCPFKYMIPGDDMEECLIGCPSDNWDLAHREIFKEG